MQKRRATVTNPPRSIPAGKSTNPESWTATFFGVEDDDPALPHIVRALGQLTLRFGFDPKDPEVRARATAVGRREWQRDQQAIAEHWSGRPERVHVVYYVRIGQLVKIGTTGQLDVRLRAYPPDAAVLAVEPGTRELEQQRHRQFRDSGATKLGEYFYPSTALIEHINSLREQPLTAADLAA